VVRIPRNPYTFVRDPGKAQSTTWYYWEIASHGRSIRLQCYFDDSRNHHHHHHNNSVYWPSYRREETYAGRIFALRRDSVLAKETKNSKVIWEEPRRHPLRRRITTPQSPLVTVKSPTFTPKTAPSLRRSASHLIHPFLDRPHSPPKHHPDSISRFHNSLVRQNDRQTDRQMD